MDLNISIQDLTVGRGHKVQLKEADGFASTYYNIPSTIVQRVPVLHQGKVSKSCQFTKKVIVARRGVRSALL